MENGGSSGPFSFYINTFANVIRESTGGIGGSWLPCVIRTAEQKMMVMPGNLNPKVNLFSLTVCTLDLYLRIGIEKTVSLP